MSSSLAFYPGSGVGGWRGRQVRKYPPLCPAYFCQILNEFHLFWRKPSLELFLGENNTAQVPPPLPRLFFQYFKWILLFSWTHSSQRASDPGRPPTWPSSNARIFGPQNGQFQKNLGFWKKPPNPYQIWLRGQIWKPQVNQLFLGLFNFQDFGHLWDYRPNLAFI